MKQLKWTTVSQYVDTETGEQITKRDATENYTIINKKKSTYVNQKQTQATVTIINECKKSKQAKLELF